MLQDKNFLMSTAHRKRKEKDNPSSESETVTRPSLSKCLFVIDFLAGQRVLAKTINTSI